jgi:hypothetical protein
VATAIRRFIPRSFDIRSASLIATQSADKQTGHLDVSGPAGEPSYAAAGEPQWLDTRRINHRAGDFVLAVQSDWVRSDEIASNFGTARDTRPAEALAEQRVTRVIADWLSGFAERIPANFTKSAGHADSRDARLARAAHSQRTPRLSNVPVHRFRQRVCSTTIDGAQRTISLYLSALRSPPSPRAPNAGRDVKSRNFSLSGAARREMAVQRQSVRKPEMIRSAQPPPPARRIPIAAYLVMALTLLVPRCLRMAFLQRHGSTCCSP